LARRARAKATSSGPTSETSLPRGLQDADGLLDRVTPDGAQRRVVVAQHGLELLLLVVDHLVGAQAAHQVDIAGAGGGAHRGAQQLGQLDREGADAAGARRNEHLLPGAQADALLQRLPGGQPDHRDRRRLHEVQVGRLQCGGALGHDRELGDRARAQVEDVGEDASPTLKRVTRLPTSVTTPARSLPSVAGSWNFTTALKSPVGIMLSIGFTLAACTWTSSSSGFSVGRGTSANPISGDLP
jgi:hypothetical protein